MAAPAATENAITASLLYAVGSGRTPSSEAPELPTEMWETIAAVLKDQGAEDRMARVVQAVRAGYEAVGADASLTISAQRYDTLRREFLAGADAGRNVWPVGSTTILKRAGGSWNSALGRVGMAASTRTRASGFGAARFTTEQYRAAVHDFTLAAARADSSTSYQNYLAWRKRSMEQGRSDLPSGPSLRNTYGSWSAALLDGEDQTPDPGTTPGGQG
ncbi:hypothetical protein [Nesterenkonia sp. Act20]|uniref:hypothetical protein n=1 Tax=Nesterenkonia sp. Act20 TaxID=1483432 RepID=UPI001C4935D2|nr:hypothetical protein [Nesterenkonia sp. Act20]